MSIPGPAPKHPSQRKRRNASIAMKALPAHGRVGRCPNFPLPTHPLSAEVDFWGREAQDLHEQVICEEDNRKRRRLEDREQRARLKEARLRDELERIDLIERDLWKQLWKTPMAVEWERLRWVHEVAQYVRHRALAELGDRRESKAALAYADRLGLTNLSLLRLRWEVQIQAVEDARAPATVTSLDAARADFS